MTKIQWTNKSWNPVTGCTEISEGCKNCYAKKMAGRLKRNPTTSHKYRKGFKVTLHNDELNKPSTWKKPQKVFVCSMGDLFHQDVPYHFIDRVFATMAQNPQHTFQILTKRPKNMLAYYHSKNFCMIDQDKTSLSTRITSFDYNGQDREAHVIVKWPLPNVWIGVTAETQETANTRIPLLMKAPAAIRFVSIEPILEEINLHRFLFDTPYTPPLPVKQKNKNSPDWIIIGGETGPKARFAACGWFKLIQFQCKLANIPFFFKSSGDCNKFSFDDIKVFDEKKFREIPEIKTI